ncbi:ATP-grasp domain-containing protein [Agaribacter marinus]|uniref:ATP-grasp domain protein n=1 Tax=Agaribacter marinus TaxID=1431249 RepID=A0AA37SSN0_9ALTE|nr:hypothetical protein [Agaribacter marinus]GLR69231.1 ATP-grasp domain protein [Agaribacter marinus]
MKRCAFLSTNNLEDFYVYDDMVKPFLTRLGWDVQDVSWHDKAVNYDEFDLIIVRSTWDYQAHAENFLACLERINASSARLENSLDLMRWNLSKCYLRSLHSKGVPILPSVWHDQFNLEAFKACYTSLQTDELVIKPLVSANADYTYRVHFEQLEDMHEELENAFSYRAFMVQAYEHSIEQVGEYSLFYFDHQFSHAIQKKPKVGDFRVQEEHGGELFSTAATKAMRQLARLVLDALPERALYARIDMLDTDRGLEIIEVELIEPSLYFNMDNASAERFAKVINNKYSKQ